MDEESTRGDRQPDDDLPGSVSNQNAEEQPDQEGGSEGKSSSGGDHSGEKASGGESGEGSQSTGNPGGAG